MANMSPYMRPQQPRSGGVYVGHDVAAGFMCRQPQQKSGGEQPRSNQHQYHAEHKAPPTESLRWPLRPRSEGTPLSDTSL